jgi:hypothetical protein
MGGFCFVERIGGTSIFLVKDLRAFEGLLSL